MTAKLILRLFVFGIVTSSCGNSALSGLDMGDGSGGAPDMAPPNYPTWSAQSPAICGQTPYTWQPSTSVGAVLESAKNLLPEPSFVISGLKVAAFLDSQLSVHHAVNYDVQTAAIRYQTQDRGKLVDATAMVTWPLASGQRFPVLLFLHPTLGYTDDCAPSKQRASLTAPMTIFSLIAASAGYIAVFPDYLNQRSLGGPSTHVTPYLLMEPTALASLDAVRAAQRYLAVKEAESATNDVYVWGHSQGAQAVEFVTALQPVYAPEFTIKAAAAISPPSDLAASAKLNFAGPAPNYNLGEAVAYAWSDYYDSAQVEAALRPPWDSMALGELSNYCNSSYSDPIKNITDPTTLFTPLFMDAVVNEMRHDPWSCWLYYNNPVTMGPPLNKSVPMLYVTGDQDTTVIPAANDPVSAKWCAQGIPIQYLQCSGASHLQTIAYSLDDVLDFFDARQSGIALPTDLCQPHPATKCKSTP